LVKNYNWIKFKGEEQINGNSTGKVGIFEKNGKFYGLLPRSMLLLATIPVEIITWQQENIYTIIGFSKELFCFKSIHTLQKTIHIFQKS
jgi:hypothetical protein